jgi:hypothetical protein
VKIIKKGLSTPLANGPTTQHMTTTQLVGTLASIMHADGRTIVKHLGLGKNTLRPPQIVITNIAFLPLVFFCKYKHHILDFFVCLQYIGLDLDLRQSFKKNTPTNIGELQHMTNICDEIILVTKYEKLHTYFKTRLVGGIFW